MEHSHKKEFAGYSLAVLITAVCATVTLHSEEVALGISDAVYRCINVIIPSLFAFMAISGIIINSRLYLYISKPFYPISRFILKMPGSLFFVFLLGNTAGYPVGVSLLSALVNQGRIPRKTAEAMSCYCYAGGPAFLTGAVGLAVFGSSKTGMLMFLSILISNFITAIVINRIFHLEENTAAEELRLDSEVLITSIENAGKSLFKMCTMIVFFAAAISAVKASGLFDFLMSISGASSNTGALFKAALEITEITRFQDPSLRDIPLICAICGFGGLCVIFQTISVCGKAFSMKLFLLTRPLCFGVQYAVSYLIFRIFKDDTLAVSASSQHIIVNFNNFVPSICLIMMNFILVFRKRLAFSKQV